MKFNNNMMVIASLLWVLLAAIPAMASDAKYVKETAAYEESLAAWAKGVKLARVQALNTYDGVRFVVDKMYWKPSKTYDNVNDLYLEIRVINSSSVYVEMGGVSFEYKDGSKRRVNFDLWQERFELAPGDITPFKYAFSGTEFKEYRPSVEAGKVALQLSPYRLMVKDAPDYVGKLTPLGEPFLPAKPRDPFWLSEKEINFSVGSAEMAAGVYNQDVSFPPYGWWPVPGLNGGYSGTLPGPMATAKAPQPMPSYVSGGQQSQQQGQPDKDGMSMEDTTEAIKSTGEAAQAGMSLIKSIGSLF